MITTPEKRDLTWKRPILHGIRGAAAAAFVLTCAAALALILSPFGVAFAEAETDRQGTAKQLEEKKRQLTYAKERAGTLREEMEAIGKERANLNEKLIAAARRVQASEEKLSGTEARLQDLIDQEEGIRDSIALRHDAISKLLAAMQRIGRQPPPAFVTRRDDALAMVRSAMLLASIYPEFKHQADNLSKELDELVRLEAGIRKERESQQAEIHRLVQQRGDIAWLLAQKKAKLASHQEELKRVREAAKAHAGSVTRLEDLLELMDKEIAQAALMPQRKQGPVELKPDAKKVAFLSPGRIKPALPFTKTRGKLPLPVRGKQIRDFSTQDQVGNVSKGISIESRTAAQVISPTDGWVVYADDFRSYGQLLIINAGGGYHVVLAGMRRIDVGLGQFVLAGEPVAIMGAKAPASGQAEKASPVLYVEFRKDGQPVDPGPWWADGIGKVQG
jgi:septal ring factor EnvC (AmiA/AmiB activator)